MNKTGQRFFSDRVVLCMRNALLAMLHGLTDDEIKVVEQAVMKKDQDVQRDND